MPLLSLGPAPRGVHRAARASLGPQEVVLVEVPATTGELVLVTDRKLHVFTWAGQDVQASATIDRASLRQLDPTGSNPHLGQEFAFAGATGRDVRFWLRKAHARKLLSSLKRAVAPT